MTHSDLATVARCIGSGWKSTGVTLSGPNGIGISVYFLKSHIIWNITIPGDSYARDMVGRVYGLGENSFRYRCGHDSDPYLVGRELAVGLVQPFLYLMDVANDAALSKKSVEKAVQQSITTDLECSAIYEGRWGPGFNCKINWAGSLDVDIHTVRSQRYWHDSSIASSLYSPRVSMRFDNITLDMAKVIAKAIAKYVS